MYDVIIVGGGNAALCAALSAREFSGKVLVLERAPEDEAGGNSRFTAGLMRVVYNGVDDLRKLIDLSEDEVRERLDRVSDYLSYEAARERAATWIADDPTEFAHALGDRLLILHSVAEPLFEGELTDRVRELYPEAQMEQLRALARQYGGELLV